MLIQHKKIDEKGMFYIGQDGSIVAELVYASPTPDRMLIEHTEVDPSLEGKGIGRQLVDTAVEYARTHQMKITPLCSFARKVFERVKDYGDVLA